MIQPVQNRLPPASQNNPTDTSTSFIGAANHLKQEIEQWVREKPGLALVLAATVGAGLAWLVKQRN